jgi:hypothetical protein
MGMYKFILIVLCCVTIMPFILCKEIYTSKENIFLIHTVGSKNSFISYVIIDGHTYIIKQKKNVEKQFSVVCDALAAYIAKDLSIAHAVEIISSHDDFPGKKRMSPGVILTIAPGAMIRDQPESKYYNLCLKQRNVKGDLLHHRWLTEQIIHQITWHKQLPIIIGLDLFICNTDRHGGNLFYDPQTNSFCAIDMDNIFRFDLPKLAYKKLKLMIRNKKRFTYEEIEALISVRDTVQFLLDEYPIKRLIELFNYFIKQADFEEEVLRAKSMRKEIAHHEATMRESRESAYRLIKILNKIINSF